MVNRERTQLRARRPCWPPPLPPLSALTSSVHPFASPTATPMGSHHAAVITQVCCRHLSMELQAGTPVFSGLSRDTELTDVYVGRDLSQALAHTMTEADTRQDLQAESAGWRLKRAAGFVPVEGRKRPVSPSKGHQAGESLLTWGRSVFLPSSNLHLIG